MTGDLIKDEEKDILKNTDNSELRHNKVAIKTIALGQLLSLLLCVQAICSGFLQEVGFHMSTGQSLFCYIMLFVVYMPWFCLKNPSDQLKHIFLKRSWKYACLAIIDVEANYLMVKAYRYTTVTSVQLLDCLTIPNVVILTMLVFGIRYKKSHFIGVFFSLLGIGALTLSDYIIAKDHQEAKNKLFGDALILIATVFYAISNIGQEFAIKMVKKEEFLAFLGMFGSLFSGCQLLLLEKAEITETNFHNYKIYLPLSIFVLALFLFYSVTPVALATGGATSLNLNLLSADFYAILVGLFLFRYTFHYLYFVGFVFIVVGVVVYHIQAPQYKDSSRAASSASRAASASTATQQLDRRSSYTDIDAIDP